MTKEEKARTEKKQKTLPEQFGHIALGFAEVVAKIDGQKASTAMTQEKNLKKG